MGVDDDNDDDDDDDVDDDDDNDDDSGTTGCPDGAGRFPCCISFIFVTLIFVMKNNCPLPPQSNTKKLVR